MSLSLFLPVDSDSLASCPRQPSTAQDTEVRYSAAAQSFHVASAPSGRGMVACHVNVTSKYLLAAVLYSTALPCPVCCARANSATTGATRATWTASTSALCLTRLPARPARPAPLAPHSRTSHRVPVAARSCASPAVSLLSCSSHPLLVCSSTPPVSGRHGERSAGSSANGGTCCCCCCCWCFWLCATAASSLQNSAARCCGTGGPARDGARQDRGSDKLGSPMSPAPLGGV